MNEELYKRAKEIFDNSHDDQDKAVEQAETEEQFCYAVAFYTGFRDAIRELFPEVDMK